MSARSRLPVREDHGYRRRVRASRSPLAGSALAALAMLGLVLLACHKKVPESSSAPGTAAAAASGSSAQGTPAAAPSASRVRAKLALTVGAQALALVPKGAGYQLDDAQGHALDRIKIESDRVKLETTSGQLVAEVKQKDYGFKVYDGAKNAVFKGKRDGAGWKIKRADGTVIAKLLPKGSKAGAARIEAKRDGANWSVTRGGSAAGSVGATLPALTATVLGLTELTMRQRVAVVVFLHEVEK